MCSRYPHLPVSVARMSFRSSGPPTDGAGQTSCLFDSLHERLMGTLVPRRSRLIPVRGLNTSRLHNSQEPPGQFADSFTLPLFNDSLRY